MQNLERVREKWDRIYLKKNTTANPDPCFVLKEFNYLLPASGRALDVACGLGGNALFLAQRGIKTTAIDISAEAIKKLAGRNHAFIDARCEAINIDGVNQYDVIVVSHFLDRTICNEIKNALVPGGLLFYQTFVLDKSDAGSGPGNPAFLLESNELLSLFSGMKVLVYSDVATVGDTSYGQRNQSYLVAQRRE